MKKYHLSIFSLAILSSLFSLAENRPSAYTKYQNWELRAVTTEDPKADGNVRQQVDLTVPIHGPWLLNPSYTTMSVNWITRVRCTAGIEYREKGQENFQRRWKTSYGCGDYESDIHTFHLSNLKPATEYEYRLINAMSVNDSPYIHTIVGREIYSFKTLDPKRNNYKVFFTADFHGGARLNLDPLYENCDGKNCDIFFFLGDNVEDSMANARYYTTFGFLDDTSRLWAKERPTIYVRGNHDAAGRESIKWREYFDHPSKKAFYTIQQGPALFIVFDIGRGNVRSDCEREISEAYMNEQLEWFKNLKKTDEWKKSTFRIALCHYGPRLCEKGTEWFGQTFKDALNEDTKNGRIHLFLSGHMHFYARQNPKTKDFAALHGGLNETTLKKAVKAYPFVSEDFNFCEVACHLVEGMTLEVTPQKLIVKSHDYRYDDGQLNDSFEVLPSGEIVETK